MKSFFRNLFFKKNKNLRKEDIQKRTAAQEVIIHDFIKEQQRKPIRESINEEFDNKTGRLELNFYRAIDYFPSSDIMHLEHLETLKIVNYELGDFSFLKNLKKLERLEIENSRIRNLEFLEHTSTLKELVLNRNGIVDIATFPELGNLKVLKLYSNNLVGTFTQLTKFTALEDLSIFSSNLKNVEFLNSLTSLRRLDLSYNEIVDVSPISNLQKLLELKLSSNRIEDISSLFGLKHLIKFDLSNNLVKNNFVLENSNYKNTFIDIYNNKIQSFPLDWYIGFITNIEYIIEMIKNIKNQAVKNQDYPRAADLRDEETKFVRILRSGVPKLSRKDYESNKNFIDDLFLEYMLSNPIESPPIEIIRKGWNEIEAYFQILEKEETDQLYEAKLLIVGEGEAGKTTLARKLVNKNAELPNKESERTEGIDIFSLKVANYHNEEKDFLVHIWDFGGQEIYHATHQFFLTKRSFYILVNNTRTNLTDFNSWLQRISILTDNSPTIIVQNQVANSSTEIDLRGLQSQFSNVLQVYDVDLSNIEDGRFEKLYNAIKFNVQQLDHLGSKLPKQWVLVRRKLEELEKDSPYIYVDEFVKVCNQNRVNGSEQISRLSSFFHDLGVFLHFRDDMILKRIIILQNNWVTKGVYMILDNKEIQKSNGHFNYSTIQQMFLGTLFESFHDEILSLMGKFELCYRIPNRKEIEYVTPQMLPIEKPFFDWNKDDNLVIFYRYDFMPKGMLPRLMVRLYRFIMDINNLAWRNGCVFYFEETTATVIETYGAKKIEIRVKGENIVKLSTLITSELDNLNSSFETLNVDKFIPCNCTLCKSSQNPHYFNYNDLMRRKSRGMKTTIECVISEEDVNYLMLLEGVFGTLKNDDSNKKIYLRKIRNSVGKNDLRTALMYLEKINTEASILLSSRYVKIEKDNYLGLTKDEYYYRELTRIGYDIIRTISDE